MSEYQEILELQKDFSVKIFTDPSIVEGGGIIWDGA
jgi:hypothetical protein